MFSNKKPSWTEQLRVKITQYVDERFEEYRGQISIDLAHGLAALAGLIAIWTLAIVCVLFVAFTLALVFGWIFSFWIPSFAYVLSFMLVATVLIAGAYYLLQHKKKHIEDPVFKIMSESLRSPESWDIKEDENNTNSSEKNREEDTLELPQE